MITFFYFILPLLLLLSIIKYFRINDSKNKTKKNPNQNKTTVTTTTTNEPPLGKQLSKVIIPCNNYNNACKKYCQCVL